ncbi:aromatic amino acid lyase, partial [Halomonas sp. SIMBA_159]
VSMAAGATDGAAPIALTGRELTPDAVAAIARAGAPVALSAEARRRVEDGHDLLARMIADGTPIYGVTTGFGALDGSRVPAEKNRA